MNDGYCEISFFFFDEKYLSCRYFTRGKENKYEMDSLTCRWLWLVKPSENMAEALQLNRTAAKDIN